MDKKIFCILLSAAANAHADVEVVAGFKLYGTIDQAFTTQSTVRAKTAAPIYKNSGFLRLPPPVNSASRANANWEMASRV